VDWNEYNQTTQPDSHPDDQAPPSGPPPMGPSFHAQFQPSQPKPSHGPILLYIGLGAVAVLLFGYGAVRSLTASPAPPKPPVRTVWSEQQQLMREAMDMAREAQRMQRAHMETMQRAMQEAEYGYAGEETGSWPTDPDD